MTTFRKVRVLLLALIDSIIVLSSVHFSFFLLDPSSVSGLGIATISILLLCAHHMLSGMFGMYKKKWRYASIEELVGIIYVVTLSVSLTILVLALLPGKMYGDELLVVWLFNILGVNGTRLGWRYYKSYGFSIFPVSRKMEVSERGIEKRTLIIGAGAAGRMLARQIKTSKYRRTLIVGFADDDKDLHHLNISGYPVLGGTDSIGEIVLKHKVNHIVIAMPSVQRERVRGIITKAKGVVYHVQTLPMIEDLALGNVSVNHVRDVQIEDLLGRDPVTLDIDSIDSEIRGKTVLVTGAGGSIGSEICRQLLRFTPAKLILLGHGENSIYSIRMELNGWGTATELIPVIANVQDRDRIFRVMATYSPSLVYHAAAHKHVPLMENNPKEAVKNNVIGTKNVAEAADNESVQTFVLVSTDKAVNPPNVMGATKRLAEMVIQMMSTKSSTKFVAVRFGNVLGSRGSVIPLFKQQIERGGPVTVTHPEMTRYFMTIPEASRLVLQAGTLANGGEIFVLDMGEPVRIVDLARNLIHLSGFTKEEIPIEFTGMRPGEKLFEELLAEDEVFEDPVFPKILVGKTVSFNREAVLAFIEQVPYLSPDEVKEQALTLANANSRVSLVAR
ncbi:nucleoside-diphosphate sugar epimerase/dehydratase [Salimicrobium flavidum]|uniref:NDP-sugar epimerase, includes UDP-GlcNAc-inverting 4,6-dehydratase FlaA1 and capsular polysaccharide biosynthesis protein EpsC n=1 Tax=Salimicrobium flavidum TaxID=570947 RepID=A0A1N7KN02_9BACI|nr:nucleoside-diphosphate sugar epimerase/dehydratase [Salimicrobium flavidum]SIS62924.1 NDP-sugar epimerase, includes UDP-GlcNAc-inverting 4,6-dehydratase FlaA1 and capsular polysaccharide biosynthesis protein EpsC [Salimicrobium flavidum]